MSLFRTSYVSGLLGSFRGSFSDCFPRKLLLLVRRQSSPTSGLGKKRGKSTSRWRGRKEETKKTGKESKQMRDDE